MAVQKFVNSPAPRTPPRADPIELACQARALSMICVLESIALNPAGTEAGRRAAARDVLEFAGGKPAVRVVQEVNVNHGPSPQVIEHMAEAEEKARMTMEVTQWARRGIPFDNWPAHVQEAAQSAG